MNEILEVNIDLFMIRVIKFIYTGWRLSLRGCIVLMNDFNFEKL